MTTWRFYLKLGSFFTPKNIETRERETTEVTKSPRIGYIQTLIEPQPIYPLAICYITVERSTIVHGKNHDFYDHVQ